MSGLFGVVAKEDCRDTLFYGTDYQSHLGTQYGGLAVVDRTIQRRIHNISRRQFKSCFFDDLDELDGRMGIGVISADDPQPMTLNSRFGDFAVVVDGNIRNKQALAAELHAEGMSFGDSTADHINSAELVAKLISLGEDVVDGIQRMFDKIQGAASVLVLTREGLYAARDHFGHSVLAVAEGGGCTAVATETTAFPNLGLVPKKFLLPGEIVHIGDDGLTSRDQGNDACQVCAFLWIYTGFPASSYEDINVETVRERCGHNLADGDDVEADFVSGVPDSGIAHALGYAQGKGIPYRRPLVKYTPGYGRSYTPPSQAIRDLVAKMKLIPITEVIRGHRIVVCDDSIVRGTQFKAYTVKKLWDCGAREVHLRIACPPLMFPCRYNISTRTAEELAARRAIKAIEGDAIPDVSAYLDPASDKYRRMVDWIANDLGVTSLKYQTADEMVQAIGLPRDRLCLYCWSGAGTE
ncbi:MAG: amidophosphoribosyltransferase [Planctomycetota bacterium]